MCDLGSPTPFLLLLGQLFFIWPEILNLANVHFVAFHRQGIVPESDIAFRTVVQKEFESRLCFSF